MSESSIETTKRNKQAFLDNYPEFQRATETAKAIGIGQVTHYLWLNSDEEYNKAFKVLKKRIDSDRLEENLKEVHRRGLEKSDLLLMFETKALAPEIYREKVADTRLIGDITIKMAIPGYDENLRLTNIIEGEVINGQDSKGKDEALQGEKA